MMFEAKLKEERTKGCVIDDIIASVVTKQGEALVTSNGFELMSDYTDTAQYKLYKKNGECVR